MTELKKFKAEGSEGSEPVISNIRAAAGQILIWGNCDTITDSTLPLTGGQYATAIKELTGAILGMIGEEIGQEGGTDYLRAVHKVDGIVCYTITPEVNAAIRLAKKYQQLIEGKS